MQVISGNPQPATHTLNGARYAGCLVLLAAVYVAAARVGFAAAAVHPVVSSAWPPSGIAFAVLVLLGLRFWPAIAVGAFVVNLLGGIPPVGALSIATGNTLEAFVGVWLLTRIVRFHPALDRLRDVLALVLLGATASTAISATVGTIALKVFGGAGGRPMETIWLAWASGDSIGILILTPLILVWATGGPPKITLRDTVEAGMLGVILVVFTTVLFELPFNYVYAIFPFTILAAVRFGRRGAATASFIVAVFAVWHTVRGVGPFVETTPINNLFELQIFIAMLALTGLILAAVIAEREAAEHALEITRQQSRQAQKMEAVGRLAGGVAHDFNNLLTVIASCTDFVLADPTLPEEHRSDLDEVKKATDRATSLTRQLLAFGRTQVLRPSTIDLNDRVAHLLPMLKRLFESTIEIRVQPAPDLWAVRADATQIEQVLLNLALNARDAMKDGGVLTFSTENTVVEHGDSAANDGYIMAPGDYALLRVRDTGIGMNAETQRKVFEPFFTTKETGKGTGLGLATAYGIVKQSGGYINLVTSPGKGAEFRIYLPRTDAVVVENVVAPPRRNGDQVRGTILLVEDEAAVRHALERLLITEGYAVLAASNGAEALETFARRQDEIELLITDIVMPAMSG
ncbi:MAG TPA: MASE1 domain-containing protein, partial [Gemmatimonadaceae bacterium]|nr:MASE1 domain-containing protein [Gemmatimonadaceae bacterium]